MVKEIKMWEARCDSCDTQFELYDGFIALNDEAVISDAVENDNNWVLLEDGRCFCPDCHRTEWDEVDDILLAFTQDGSQLLGKVK
jgi:predicted HNH restriction endonuclease